MKSNEERFAEEVKALAEQYGILYRLHILYVPAVEKVTFHKFFDACINMDNYKDTVLVYNPFTKVKALKLDDPDRKSYIICRPVVEPDRNMVAFDILEEQKDSEVAKWIGTIEYHVTNKFPFGTEVHGDAFVMNDNYNIITVNLREEITSKKIEDHVSEDMFKALTIFTRMMEEAYGQRK